MKEIVVNLKRFDIPKSYCGVSKVNPEAYIESILLPIVDEVKKYKDIEFIIYPPESYLIQANQILKGHHNLRLGCQSNFYEDVSENGNFGAFTTSRTATAMKAIGCTSSLIGHFEERKKLNQLYQRVGVNNQKVVNQILNEEITQALSKGMDVCYCIGESEEQLGQWEEVLLEQLEIGLKDIDRSRVIIGYEPIWSIGPGKTPADAQYIAKVTELVKSFDSQLRIIYGGGVKKENAAMIARIKQLDGGLIGLTNFKENIGFHADEFLEIVDLYHDNLKGE